VDDTPYLVVMEVWVKGISTGIEADSRAVPAIGSHGGIAKFEVSSVC
jgi:hypothetical protein